MSLTKHKKSKAIHSSSKTTWAERGDSTGMVLFNNGVMVDAMSTEIYKHNKHRLSPLGMSTRQLRMANGIIVNLLGC